MKFSQILANAFARRVAYVIVALFLAWIGIGKAHAATSCPNSPPFACDEGQAYSQCVAQANSVFTGSSPIYRNQRCILNSTGLYMPAATYDDVNGQPSTDVRQGEDYFWYFGNSCAGRPQGQPGMINGTLTSSGVCNTGCKMVPNTENANQDFTMYESGNSINFKQGTWVPTGGVCVVDPTTPQQPPVSQQGCHTTSSGHKVCKGAGKTCVTSPSGFTACASDPNSTGLVRTNNPRTEAVSISAPNTPNSPPINRPGESWSTSTSTTTITNNTTSEVTNITNYNNTGTPNGNVPTPGDGSGQGEEGEEEEPGSVGGGGDCATPFTCSGGDPILCGVGQQVWLDRCANDANNDGQPDWTAVEGDGSEGAGEEPDGMPHKEDVRLGVGMLDEGGLLGGGACPTFGTVTNSFGTFDLDEQGNWCDLLQLANGFFKLLGGFIALRILMA